ncbi:single-stranded-DNA-specific exonuclease RecJ [Commensalibacter oyaizuii]|uniref:Single-stranded-DNA-specific exonuclease RecJ n=1 Tax=Commensalibacter oyaizuii TaxID=3043873 RepID=A0ABT6Q0Z2_9PROT|nr:single-stranded-DNA-specific exonuclease RecJ [Commensalibacter sp. TBRC 16381]MDI2090784.1 single-stranded-DNA-specific exonuclease RecJ [Commensalibacter sp. TBRC 16381]
MTENHSSSEASLVLNTKQSFSGRRWLWRQSSSHDPMTLDRYAQLIAQKASISEIVGKMIAIRGVSPEQVNHFLSPTLRSLLPDPSCLKDMDIAANRIAKAVINHEKIAIFGDYDVDGGCSTAILTDLFTGLGIDPVTYIPDRFKEGYGPNVPAIEGLVQQGIDLIICVDCGTAAHHIFREIPQDKTDIVVLDHHKSETPPPILATVNPNRLDCTSGLGYLCAGGVSFLTAVAVIRALRQQKFFENHPEPNLFNLLDLVALSTVCDVMPLTGLNRALVTQGLKIMAKRERIGIAALLDVAGVNNTPDAFSCGFALGPRINAGGRISESDLGVRLLTCKNPVEAHQLAERLDTINKQRQSVEKDMLQNAIDRAMKQHEQGNSVIMLHDLQWHPGIVGIVAGRIKEQINRPTLIGAELSDGTVKGSGRSIPGLDLGAAIIAAKQAGLLLHGGGHAMAAGYSYHIDQAPMLHDFLNKYLAKAAQCPTVVDLEIEGITTLAGASVELAKQIERLTPFGNGNDEPLIVLSNVHILRSDRIGKDGNTLRLTLQGEDGASIKALIFKADQNPIVPFLEDFNNRRPVHLAGWLRVNSWNGRESADFFIKDATFA